ncbi:MAG: WecB/TagA/CpsF family glycosyltransferase [Leptospirales bacterium]
MSKNIIISKSIGSSKEDDDPILDFQNIDLKKIENSRQVVSGVPFYGATLNELVGLSLHQLEKIRKTGKSDAMQHVLPLNPYNFFRCRFNKKYFSVLRESFINLPAEKGMIGLTNIVKTSLPQVIPISQYLMNLIRVAQEKNYTIYMIGSSTGVLDKLQTNLLRSFPRLRITGKHHGQLKGKAKDNVIESVRKTDPHIVILSLGFKQELNWVMQNSELLKRSLLVNLGGGLNVMAGKKKPAPDFIVDANVTWFWRILSRPYLWYRFFVLGGGYLHLVYLRLFKKKGD